MSERPPRARPYLSIVIPAYNEAARLPRSIASIRAYLEQQPYTSELIVVDDGSEDDTIAAAERAGADWPGFRLIRNPHRGKAFAVRTGVLQADGDVIFQCDADLSMPIEEIAKFLPRMDDGYGVAIGSREGPGAHRYGEPGFRHLIGRGFNYLVRLLAVGGIQDTQCGFKCFRRDAARDLFPRMRVRADGGPLVGPMVSGFDVEILYLARKRGYRIAEIGIDWYYVAGSKVSPLKDSFRMFADVVKIRVNDLRGAYELPVAGAPEATHG